LFYKKPMLYEKHYSKIGTPPPCHVFPGRGAESKLENLRSTSFRECLTGTELRRFTICGKDQLLPTILSASFSRILPGGGERVIRRFSSRKGASIDSRKKGGKKKEETPKQLVISSPYLVDGASS